jgi:hypothetical protein
VIIKLCALQVRVQSTFLTIKTVKSMKSYKKPQLVLLEVITEAGFATSVNVNTPGGEFDYNDYGNEL